MTIEIRPITETDVDGFHAALDAVSRERKYLLFLEAQSVEKTADYVRLMLAGGHAQWLAIEDGAVVGWCDVTPEGRETVRHVGTLGMGVVARHRGRGIGEGLLRATLAAAFDTGLTRIELGVLSTNIRAVQLYRKVGFVDEGIFLKRVIIDSVQIDEIRMAKFAADIVRGA
jgi:RimJ/RimL family protein N-acetyltransferase